MFSYPCFKLYNLLQKSTGYLLEKWLSYRCIGYWPNIKNPKSYNEKIIWKKIYDRNPLLTMVADKYEVRNYVKQVLGEEKSNEILLPLYFVTERPEQIPFNSLPENYIIKANNASGRLIIAEKTDLGTRFRLYNGKDNSILYDSDKTRKVIIRLCRKWLSMTCGFSSLEWCYQKIKRKIIIEKLLKNKEGNLPDDYKFNVFHGKCHLIQVYYDKFIRINRAWYTPEWKYIKVKQGAEYRRKPAKLKEMIEISETLAKPFDFIRVDLYMVENNIYFGELTNYPMGGRTRFTTIPLDFKYGKKWRIIPNYWKKK